VLESVLHWAGVVDELEFAKVLLNWCKHGYPELGDHIGRGVRGILAKVLLIVVSWKLRLVNLKLILYI